MRSANCFPSHAGAPFPPAVVRAGGSGVGRRPLISRHVHLCHNCLQPSVGGPGGPCGCWAAAAPPVLVGGACCPGSQPPESNRDRVPGHCVCVAGQREQGQRRAVGHWHGPGGAWGAWASAWRGMDVVARGMRSADWWLRFGKGQPAPAGACARAHVFIVCVCFLPCDMALGGGTRREKLSSFHGITTPPPPPSSCAATCEIPSIGPVTVPGPPLRRQVPDSPSGDCVLAGGRLGRRGCAMRPVGGRGLFRRDGTASPGGVGRRASE